MCRGLEPDKLVVAANCSKPSHGRRPSNRYKLLIGLPGWTGCCTAGLEKPSRGTAPAQVVPFGRQIAGPAPRVGTHPYYSRVWRKGRLIWSVLRANGPAYDFPGRELPPPPTIPQPPSSSFVTGRPADRPSGERGRDRCSRRFVRRDGIGDLPGAAAIPETAACGRAHRGIHCPPSLHAR